MFVLKSVHEALLKAKDEQMATLKEEVAFLRSMVNPVNKVNTHNAFVIASEANAVLDGAGDQIILDHQEDPEILAERDRLLSGNY